MYIPEFPYKGNQIILTSDRVTIHSKSDAIFIFGKQAVSLSSPQTITLDATQKVLIDSPKIELGRKAELDGDPLVLGRKLNSILSAILFAITLSAKQLKQVSTTNPGSSMQYIRNAGDILHDVSEDLKIAIDNDYILSKNTFTN